MPPAYYPPPPSNIQDPMFSPSDPTLAQANYPQPPYSMHNQSPNPGKTAIICKVEKKRKTKFTITSAIWSSTTSK